MKNVREYCDRVGKVHALAAQGESIVITERGVEVMELTAKGINLHPQWAPRRDALPAQEIPLNAPSDEARSAKAVELLRLLHGWPVASAKAALAQAEFFLNASTVLDCTSKEFAATARGFGRAPD